MVLDPSYQLYTWIRSRLFTPRANSSDSTPRDNTTITPPGNASPGIRRRGNIHRLTGDRPDDDNNTWNGNSTQQM